MNPTPAKFNTAMVIDDNNIDLYITARVMRKNNIAKEVLEFSSALAALEYLRRNQDNLDLIPQLLFVDIYMPQMSGFEFMEAFDTLPLKVKQHCRCYIISSTIDEKDIDRANADKNVVGFEEKPVKPGFFEGIG
jgi:CheY-like chemotaxis protein